MSDGSPRIGARCGGICGCRPVQSKSILQLQRAWPGRHPNASLELAAIGRKSLARQLQLLAIRAANRAGRASHSGVSNGIQLGRGANQKPADLSPIQPRLWRRRRSHRWRRDYEHALLAIQHTTIRHLSRAWPLVDAGCPQLRESTIAVTFAVTAIFFAQPAKSSLSASMLRRRLSSTRSALYRISNMLAAMRYQRDELAKTEKTPLIAAFHAACISLTNVWHMHCQIYGIVPTNPPTKRQPPCFCITCSFWLASS